MKCLNLCEIMCNSLFEGDNIVMIGEGIAEYERVYFGSYFCSNYFNGLNCIDKLSGVCEKDDLKCTLVVPVFSQSSLERGKKNIEKMVQTLAGYLDEITVNDVGMLCYVNEKYSDLKINLGRLFFKDARDPRIVEMNSLTFKPAVPDTILKCINKASLGVLEIDEVSDVINTDDGMEYGIHYPLCYITCGFICKYASVHKTIDKKFRPNDECLKECLRTIEIYRGEDEPGNPLYYRLGRAVYFNRENRAQATKSPQRNIYFPVYEMSKWIDRNN